MLALTIVVVTAGLLAAIVTLLTHVSGRQHAGQITQSLGNEIDYDDPYPGWGSRLFGANAYFEKKLAQPPKVTLDEWPLSRSR